MTSVASIMLPASDKASASPLKEDKVDKIIKKMREDLMSDGFYLGDLTTLKKVAWVRDGRADRLAVVEHRLVWILPLSLSSGALMTTTFG